ncbi:hypothetical protein [Nocardioides sp.]|uniref:hypothetical protein n=1 Tax=Nocardioides sp. TaxID=35761 RepID=UPI00286DE94A|nr:hypothetical protein [Nocardioides sp.]
MMRASLLTLVVAFMLSACGSDTTEPDATASPTASETATEQAAPTQLSFGDAESVTWQPTADVSGELTLQVDRVRAGDFADFDGLAGSGITQDNQPFYVDALIVNQSDLDLGGLDVPLYLQDSNGTLSPPWGFARPFKPCDSGPLPVPFAAGDRADLCLVFFGSPGAGFESVTFQPTLDAAAVTWTGEVAEPVLGTKPRKKPR